MPTPPGAVVGVAAGRWPLPSTVAAASAVQKEKENKNRQEKRAQQTNKQTNRTGHERAGDSTGRNKNFHLSQLLS